MVKKAIEPIVGTCSRAIQVISRFELDFHFSGTELGPQYSFRYSVTP